MDIDMFRYLDMDATTGYEVELCKECIQWACEEKRLFLRQALEVSRPFNRVGKQNTHLKKLSKGDARLQNIMRGGVPTHSF